MEKNKWGRNRLRAYGISDQQRIQELESGKIWCCGHKQFLPRESFSRQDRTSCQCRDCQSLYKKNWHSLNKPERNKKNRDYYAQNRQRLCDYQRTHRATLSPQERHSRARWYALKRKYGITKEQYEVLLASQQGTCAVCKGTHDGKPLFLDHNHTSKKIRGILCVKCNTIIGFLEMNRELVPLCEAYLISHQ